MSSPPTNFPGGLDDPDSALFAVYYYLVPIAASVSVCASPLFVFKAVQSYLPHSPAPSLSGEVESAFRKPLSGVTLFVVILSPVFLLSNFASQLYLYAVYSSLLAVATLALDKVGHKKFWPVLWVWHVFNLINVLGGHPWVIMPYSTTEDGLIRAAGSASSKCSTPIGRDSWCAEWWLATQVIVAFVYTVLHIIAFGIVTIRSSVLFHEWISDSGNGTSVPVRGADLGTDSRLVADADRPISF
eukprot:TRINITY_DN50721_c0_g1_i1.p1 TRINITY_DN50721_c0_g1~~TRINITY_DN50721_c0_g1_i1.p1  ORF type:complete len:243 (+),score=28.26 TRINITY_DN50721_c0_g1_i1:59-787(+)